MTRPLVRAALAAVLCVVPASKGAAQVTAAAAFESWRPPTPGTAQPASTLVTVPDSVRRPVGYQHWKYAAIGSGVGLVAGLLLSTQLSDACSDCDPGAPLFVTLSGLGAGAGGVLGFLVGLATPKYAWVP